MVGPAHGELLLRVERPALVGERGGRDLVRGQILARRQLEHVEPAGDFGGVDAPVVPVARPVAARAEHVLAHRTAVEIGDLVRRGRVGEVHHRHAALIPGLYEDVAARHRDDGPVVGDAVLHFRLGGRHLVVAGEIQLAVIDLVDRVGAPGHGILRPAARSSAAAPLVGEDHLGAGVVEGRRVPVGEPLVHHRVDARGRRRIGDVQNDAVA